MTTAAAERIAALRDECAHIGEDIDHLTDLDLLNQYAENRERDCINTRDRYMKLLTEQSKYDEQVQAGVRSAMLHRLDILATGAIRQKAHELTRILDAIDVLPDRATAERVAGLKTIAADTRHMLRRIEESDAKDPVLDDNRALVNAARTVVNVLRDKPGVSASEVIRLVGEALAPNGNLHDLLDVAYATPVQREQPSFAGAGWTEMGGGTYWIFEPDGIRYRIFAYRQGTRWFLDLQGLTGALIAAGETSEMEVAATAAVLIEQAPELARSGLRPWQCWKRATCPLTEPGHWATA